MALKHMMGSREVIVRGEAYATTKARSEPAAELNNDTIGALVEKVGAVSIAELEKSIPNCSPRAAICNPKANASNAS
jgi:hypothetical protein